MTSSDSNKELAQQTERAPGRDLLRSPAIRRTSKFALEAVRPLLALAMLSLVLSSNAWAVNSIRLGSAAGNPGDTVGLPVFASFDTDIQGFTIAATWTGDVQVLPGSVVIPNAAFSGVDFVGSEPSLISPTPEFLVVEDNVDISGVGTATVGAIFDMTTLQSVPASPDVEVLLCRLQFAIDPIGTPEIIDIGLGTPVGTPPIRTSLSSFGQSLQSLVEGGTLIIESEYEVRADSLQAQSGDNVDVFIRMTNPLELTGFQIVFTYDPNELRIFNLEDGLGNPLVGAAPNVAYDGTDLGAFVIANSIVPESQSLDIIDLPNGRRLVALGFIPDFVPPFDQPLIPVSLSGQSFIRLDCQLLQDNVTIDVTNTAVTPPAVNLVTLANGADVNPGVRDGILYSSPANILLQQINVVAPNSTGSIGVVATSPLDITGYTFSISYDPLAIEIDTNASPAVWLAGTSASFDPTLVGFFSTNLLPAALNDGGVDLSVVEVMTLFDGTEPFDPLLSIPSGSNRTIARVPLIVGNDFNGAFETTLTLETGFLPNEVLVAGTTPIPTFFSSPQVSSADIVLGGDEFIRGDVDLNGIFGINDAVFLLAFLFSGGATPPCQDAADANDSENVDLSDVIQILSFLFSGATIPSPNPNCGIDTTPDAFGDQLIGCEAYPLSTCP